MQHSEDHIPGGLEKRAYTGIAGSRKQRLVF